MRFSEHDSYMGEALILARQAAENGEIPIGCIVVCCDKIIASGINSMRHTGLAGHHAEILALEEAVSKTNAHSLEDCILYTTLEPCGMCSGAIAHYRVGEVVFGAYDPEYGCMFSKINLPQIMGQNIKCVGGVLEAECAELIDNYFKQMRTRTN